MIGHDEPASGGLCGCQAAAGTGAGFRSVGSWCRCAALRRGRRNGRGGQGRSAQRCASCPRLVCARSRRAAGRGRAGPRTRRGRTTPVSGSGSPVRAGCSPLMLALSEFPHLCSLRFPSWGVLSARRLRWSRHSSRWRGVLADAEDFPHLVEALDTVVRKLGGVTQVWRFDRMATVCSPTSGRISAAFAQVAKHYEVRSVLCPPRHGNRKGRGREGQPLRRATLVAHAGRRRHRRPIPDRAGPGLAVKLDGRRRRPRRRAHHTHGGGTGRSSQAARPDRAAGPAAHVVIDLSAYAATAARLDSAPTDESRKD
jgi:hypothetical protein